MESAKGGNKAIRSVSVDWDVWYEAKRIIRGQGLTVSDVVENALRLVVAEQSVPKSLASKEE